MFCGITYRQISEVWFPAHFGPKRPAVDVEVAFPSLVSEHSLYGILTYTTDTQQNLHPI